jgi:hypothetical protein
MCPARIPGEFLSSTAKKEIVTYSGRFRAGYDEDLSGQTQAFTSGILPKSFHDLALQFCHLLSGYLGELAAKALGHLGSQRPELLHGHVRSYRELN